MEKKRRAFAPNNKGIQGVITTFLLIVLIVSIVMLLIHFNYQGALQESLLSKGWYTMEYRTTVRNRIVNCFRPFDKTDMAEIISDMNRCIPPKATGYAIERIADYGCNYGCFETGKMDNCANRLIFYMNIPQDRTKHCIAKLTVCME